MADGRVRHIDYENGLDDADGDSMQLPWKPQRNHETSTGQLFAFGSTRDPPLGWLPLLGGPSPLWRENTTLTEDLFSGVAGTRYDNFEFKVRDGTEYSVASYTLTVNVTVAAKPWQNAGNRFDVSGSQGVTAQDVLTIINHVNAHLGDSSLPAPSETPGAPVEDQWGIWTRYAEKRM